MAEELLNAYQNPVEAIHELPLILKLPLIHQLPLIQKFLCTRIPYISPEARGHAPLFLGFMGLLSGVPKV